MSPWGFYLKARGFVTSLFKSELQVEVANIVNGLGEKNVRWLLENKRPLTDFLPAERERELRQKAPRYARVAKLISEEDLYNMVPGWARDLVSSYGEGGREWLTREVAWMRGFFGGGDGKQPVVQDRPGGGLRITRVRLPGAGTDPAPQPPAGSGGDNEAAGPQGPAAGAPEEDE